MQIIKGRESSWIPVIGLIENMLEMQLGLKAMLPVIRICLDNVPFMSEELCGELKELIAEPLDGVRIMKVLLQRVVSEDKAFKESERKAGLKVEDIKAKLEDLAVEAYRQLPPHMEADEKARKIIREFARKL